MFDWRSVSGAGARNRSNIGDRIGEHIAATGRVTPGLLVAPRTHDSLVFSAPAHAGTNADAHYENGSLPAVTAAWEAGESVTDPDAVDGGFCAGWGDHRRPSEANIENLHFL